MKLTYQTVYECEGCGAIGHVEPYVPDGRWHTPMPPGWGLAGELRLIDGSGTPHGDFCATCMRLPLGELVDKMLARGLELAGR